MTEVVVVGGGAIGSACAWRLAATGVAVTLVDERPGSGASWAAAGMIAPATEAHYGEEELLGLNLASAARWPAFADELADAAGRDAGYRANGTIVVARDADDLPALEELLAFQRRLGLDVERLSSREARDLEPGLATTVRAAVLAGGDHQVDNRALVDALLAAGERAGVATVRARAVGLEVAGERVRAVRLADGTTRGADVVVLAAGAWSASLDGLPPGSVPVRPVKGQLLHLRGPADPPLAVRNVRAVGGRPGRPVVYVVPRDDGRVVVGATAEERGFDTAVTAGAVLDLLRESYELLPGVTELDVTELTTGLRPGTPDNAPIVGPGPLEGVVTATGHFRNGILLTPVTADAVAEIVTTGEVPVVVKPFGPERFHR